MIGSVPLLACEKVALSRSTGTKIRLLDALAPRFKAAAKIEAHGLKPSTKQYVASEQPLYLWHGGRT